MGGVFPPCVTVIWALLLFMVEVKVIIVTHGNPRPTGRETAPQGDSGEKGLACSASTGCAFALAVADRNRYTHMCTCALTHT